MMDWDKIGFGVFLAVLLVLYLVYALGQASGGC